MRKLFSLTAACAALALGSAACTVSAAEWGTVKGQILLSGDLPKLDPIVRKGDATAKDAAVCAAQDVPNEKLVVDADSKGIKNVVIYIQKKPAAVHPDLAEPSAKEVTFDQKGCQFLPHVLLVQTGQSVRVLSDDAVAHNTHTNTIKTPAENFVVPANDRKGILMKPFKTAERLPTRINCDIHAFMEAYWVILDHPYMAVTDDKGNFEIPNLPTGTHEFIVWHERCGYLDKKYSVDVKAGMNEQKPLKYSAAQIMK